MGRFDDQVAIVTGAGSGTGAAIATQLAKEGASVACTDLDGAEETAALLGERGRAVRLDVADAGSVARLMAEVRETYGRLDALFNSAGVDGMVRPLTDLSEELTVAERTCRVNFLRPFDTGRAVCYSDQPAESAGPRLGAGSKTRRAKREADPGPWRLDQRPTDRRTHARGHDWSRARWAATTELCRNTLEAVQPGR